MINGKHYRDKSYLNLIALQNIVNNVGFKYIFS